MSDFQNLSSILFFLLFFMPGFISLKCYDLLIASEKRDFSKAIYEVVGFSALNYAALSWLIALNYHYNSFTNHFILFSVSLVLILFIFPIAWPVLMVWLIKKDYISRRIISPIKRPWDWYFSKRMSAWVIITLKDGRKIGGIFANKSFASSYPLPEQIYLETICILDEFGRFQGPVERSKGVIILGEDMSTVEFFGDQIDE